MNLDKSLNNIDNRDICETHGATCDRRCVDPNVDNGMMTKVWGPTGWLFLHCVTFGYPYAINPSNPDHKYKKQQYKTFFQMIGYVLPCKYCRESYIEFAKQTPIDKFLNTRKDLCKWLYIIHNKVNTKLGVPESTIPTFQEVQQFYEQFRAKCKKTTEEERAKNKEVGCVRPADGTPKRCLINVINCKEGDVTRRENSIVYLNNNIQLEEFFNWKNWVVPFIILTIIFSLLHYLNLTKFIKTIRKKFK